jgi:hypothetical protein
VFLFSNPSDCDSAAAESKKMRPQQQPQALCVIVNTLNTDLPSKWRPGAQDHSHLEYWTWPGRPAGYLVDLHFGDSLPRGFAQRSAKLLSEHL